MYAVSYFQMKLINSKDCTPLKPQAGSGEGGKGAVSMGEPDNHNVKHEQDSKSWPLASTARTRRGKEQLLKRKRKPNSATWG